MKNIIPNHPALLHAQSIKDICSPLKNINISYFSHVRIDCENQFSAISNNPEFHEHYLKNKYYNADIHMASQHELGKIILWDAISCSGESEKMNVESENFNIRHSFTIVDTDKTIKNYYHFSTHLKDKSINQVYLTNIDFLKMFILHFNNKISESTALLDAYQFKYGITTDKSEFNMNQIKSVNSNKFLAELNLYNSSEKCNFSLRELEILKWLYQGKTIEQISVILSLAQITIKKHISTIKAKTGCYTQFQLGTYFQKILNR